MGGEVPWRWRLVGAATPVVVGTVALLAAPLYSSQDLVLATAHWALLLVGAACLVPALLVSLVRPAAWFASGAALLTVLTVASVVVMQRSSSSTNALVLLWVPLVGIPAGLAAVAADRALRRPATRSSQPQPRMRRSSR